MQMLKIVNDGQKIKETNYWDMEHAQKGYVFLSFNAGAFRLLLPESLLHTAKEMRTAKEVIISRGPWADQGDRDAVEILFEDYTDSPFVLHLTIEQVDLVPNRKRGDLAFSVWSREGKIASFPGKYRKVTRIPCLQSWK